MDRRLLILEKLTLISEKDWKVVLKKAKDHVRIRLRGKTSFGVHSEANLGMSAEDYYATDAIKKIYEEDSWDWKFEEFTLIEQIIRIINSSISEKCRKWENSKSKQLVTSEFDDNFEIGDFSSDNSTPDETNDQISRLEHIIGDDEECFMLLHGLLDKKNYDEICELIGCQKKKLYKIIEKLRRFINMRDEE